MIQFFQGASRKEERKSEITELTSQRIRRRCRGRGERNYDFYIFCHWVLSMREGRGRGDNEMMNRRLTKFSESKMIKLTVAEIHENTTEFTNCKDMSK